MPYKDPKKRQEQNRKYHQKHKEQHNAVSREYYQKHRGRLIAYSRKYSQKHKEQTLAYARKYRPQHLEESRDYNKKWAKENPEKAREKKRRRRVRKAHAPGSHTAEQIQFLRSISGGFCPGYNRGPHYVGEEALTADHTIPLAQGGSDYIENIGMMCRPCNSAKGAS